MSLLAAAVPKLVLRERHICAVSGARPSIYPAMLPSWKIWNG